MNNEIHNGSGAQYMNQGSEPASVPYVNPGSHAEFHSYGGPGAPMGQPPEEEKKKKKTVLIVIIAVVLAALIGVGVFCTWWFAGGGSDFFDDAAINGQAPYKTQEEIIAELNRVVEEGMLNISIASVIDFETGTSEGTAYIENVPSNRYVLRVSIALDSTGEVVYQSGGLRPDSYIENITLNEDLPAGTYPATATFVAYDPDSLEEVGQAVAKITLNVAS